MGQTQSNVKSLQQRYGRVYVDILQIGQEIVNTAAEMGWDENNPTLCQRIEILQGQMFDWASDDALREAGLRIGIRTQPTAANQAFLDSERQRICVFIGSYFQTKISIVNYIRDNLQNLCEDTVVSIPDLFPTILAGSNSAVAAEAWRRVEEANEGLYRWYTELDRLVKVLAQPISLDQLQRLFIQIVNLLNNGNRGCCGALTNLRDFTWYENTNEYGQTEWYNPYSVDSEPSRFIQPTIPIVGTRPQGLLPRVSIGNTTCNRLRVPLEYLGTFNSA